MDGVHDLGGEEGYGPVQVDYVSEPFDKEWEGREWGIAQCARTPNMTIDWWRYCRELIMPEDYLSRPYLDSWAQTDFATYIEAGWISLEEIDHQVSLSSMDYSGDCFPPLRHRIYCWTSETMRFVMMRRLNLILCSQRDKA